MKTRQLVEVTKKIKTSFYIKNLINDSNKNQTSIELSGKFVPIFGKWQKNTFEYIRMIENK